MRFFKESWDSIKELRDSYIELWDVIKELSDFIELWDFIKELYHIVKFKKQSKAKRKKVLCNIQCSLKNVLINI